MTAAEATATRTAPAALGGFERHLSLRVALCILAGILLGHLEPGVFVAVAAAEIARVNLPVAVLVWLMIVPMALVLLFGFQGERILAQPLVIALLAVPILLQVYPTAGLAYWLSRRLGLAWCVAAPAALIGASNFFELAVATAISPFAFGSGAALATVVGVLVEVPVMLFLVRIATATRGWYEGRPG